MSSPDQAQAPQSTSAAEGALGRPHLHLRRTDSTNERLRELAIAGAPHGTLVTADEQTAGRGRHGRRWSAPPRSALLMSLLLRWQEPCQAPALLPHLAAVAVCDVVGPHALVKWPNDVVVRRQADPHLADANHRSPAQQHDFAKLAGILIEGRPQERWLVLGIGLNVAVDLHALPQEVQRTAASMSLDAGRIEPTLAALLDALATRLTQPVSQIVACWRSRDALAGSQVTWSRGAGVAEGINERGALLVRRGDGSLAELDSGEVSVSFHTSRAST